jgi:hypothetical protein
MQLSNAMGARLNAKLFINTFDLAKKIAPPRFLTLRLHPDRYKELYALADVPKSIQLGMVQGPLGKRIWKVNVITPPMGVVDGMDIKQDSETDPTKLVFEVHGIPELVLENLAL